MERNAVPKDAALRAIEKALALSLPADEEAVERVARAVRRNRFVRTGRGGVFDEAELNESELDDARAAIAAMPLKGDR